MAQVRWLDDDQQHAWQGMLVFINRGIPEMERTLKEHGLLVVHFAILVALSDSPGHTLGLSELADVANLSQSRLTHRLRTLSDRGFVSVQSNCDDGRAKNATLTDTGMAKLDAVSPLHAEDVQRILFDHLDPAETKVLASALAKVAGGLCNHECFRTPD